jgi:hypothetical protein
MSTSFQLDARFFERLDQGGGVFCSEAEGNSCGKILSTTPSAGIGDCRLLPNFSMRSASLSMSFKAKLGEKSRFQNILAIAHEQR